jgi:hypothetical protein
MADPLASSRYSIEHAKRHIEEFKREVKAWVDSKPYTSVEEPVNAAEKVVKIILTTPLPAALPGLLFDAANNLRASLDQAGHAVALAAGHSGKDAHFPFGETLQEVESRAKRGSSEFPKEVFDAMVAQRPYKGGNDVLWGLNKVCNAGKHASLVRTDLINGPSTTWVVKPPLTKRPPPPRWDPARNEMVILTIPGASECDLHFWCEMHVVIGDVQGVGGRDSVRILDKMLGAVEGALVTVEAEARRIGLFD